MTAIDPRDRYLSDAVATATPARLVTMLYERLCRDLHMGIEALENGAYETAGVQLMHAQDIVIELRSSLRPELWSGGPAMAELYVWVLTSLIKANVARDVALVRDVLAIVEDLAGAWTQAASAVSQPAARIAPLAAAV